ncbi:hypothetical protein GCM10023093_17050 [Nemorincola caseinilytica]|uniref:Phage protein D n=1 Tax=Nemorincola caseinilytica TaxID=2054315 RepID=A0ABP8NG17_9BACT
MALYTLNSEITIDDLQFRGVHEVRIERGIHGYEHKAFINVPHIAHIMKGKRAVPAKKPIGDLFKDGARVSIKLGYDKDLRTEFEGFVVRRNAGMPTEIECEGYCRQLREQKVTAKLSKGMTVKELLELACKGTDVAVECKVDLTLYGKTLTDHTGLQILDEIKKSSDGALNIFFIEPRKLWCGLLYTPFLAGTDVFSLPTVKYRLGWNCLKENDLRERVPNEPVQIYFNGTLVNGDTVRVTSDDDKAKRKEKASFHGIKQEKMITSFVNEKAKKMNYTGYEGSFTSFLQPFALPGYTAMVKDGSYPARDGKYMIESTVVTFGVNGARRHIELGAKMGGANG